jgi:hypothetical protein
MKLLFIVFGSASFCEPIKEFSIYEYDIPVLADRGVIIPNKTGSGDLIV